MGLSVSRPTLGQEELSAVGGVFETGWLGLGDRTKAFEDAVAERASAKHAVGVSTGTSALHLALSAAGVGPGHEVILPSLTFVACAQAVLATGAKPVFCDVNDDDLQFSLGSVQRLLTTKTRAVMPVHYTGHVGDMDGLLALARDKNFVVVEDAAHAFGSFYKGRPVGSFGHLTCFSFDPIKVITCIEGGAVATSNDEWAEKVRRQRLLGIDGDSWSRYQNKRRWFYDVPEAGFRYHLPNVNAAVGLAQLKKMDAFIARRREVVRRYDDAFALLDGVKRLAHDVDSMAPFTYVLRVSDGRRDAFMTFLKERDVDTGVHYIPNHFHSLFRDNAEPLPVTESAFKEMVTLPLFSHISDAEADRVINAAADFFRSGRA